MRNAGGRPSLPLLMAKEAWRLTPNMIRAVFARPELAGFPEGKEGGICKPMIPIVDESKESPASRWASHAKPDDFLEFTGPSGPKVTHFEADRYLVAADPSAVPAAAAALETMPRNAKGVAIFKVTTGEDRPGSVVFWDQSEGLKVLLRPQKSNLSLRKSRTSFCTDLYSSNPCLSAKTPSLYTMDLLPLLAFRNRVQSPLVHWF